MATSGSSALVTSSQMISFGLAASERAMQTRCFCPPDKFGRVAVGKALAHLDLLEQFGDAPVALGAAHAEVEFQRPADDGADGLARVHRHIGHLVDHLQLPQIVLAAVGQPVCERLAAEGDGALAQAAAGR